MTEVAQRVRKTRLRWALGCTTIVLALSATICRPPQPRVLWNASASAPIGLWSVAPEASIHRGDMVVARLSPHWRRLAAERHYLPSNVPLIKRVAAIPGDNICAVDDRIEVNGRAIAARLKRDKMGRPLPSWRGCISLRHGMLLLLMDHPASFDGRYFGPSKHADIIGKAKPLWLV